jgi:hypothetical protein
LEPAAAPLRIGLLVTFPCRATVLSWNRVLRTDLPDILANRCLSGALRAMNLDWRPHGGFEPRLPGVKKLLAILHQLGKDLAVVRTAKGDSGPNFLRMARVTANVSYREALTEDELVHALLTGRVAHSKRPHLGTLLQEAPKPMIEGLIQQVGGWNKATDRIRKNLRRIAQQLDVERSDAPWRQAA